MVSFEPRVQKHREVPFLSAQCQAETQVLQLLHSRCLTGRVPGFNLGIKSREYSLTMAWWH